LGCLCNVDVIFSLKLKLSLCDFNEKVATTTTQIFSKPFFVFVILITAYLQIKFAHTHTHRYTHTYTLNENEDAA